MYDIIIINELRKFTMLNMNEIPQTGLKKYIANLARQHNVRYVETKSSQLAKVITHLSDDEIKSDNTEKLVVALRKAEVINGSEMLVLLGRHLDEVYSV